MELMAAPIPLQARTISPSSTLNVLQDPLGTDLHGSIDAVGRLVQVTATSCRTDLEKAMKNLGGSIKVANMIGWQLSYKVKKPRGWWDRATNVQAEMDEFIEDHGLPERVLPSKNTFIKAGR